VVRWLVFAGTLTVVACGSRPVQISNSGKGGAYDAALVAFTDGFAVAWYDTRHGSGEIYLRLLDANGQPAGPERRLTKGPEDSYEASLERLGDGLVVAWYDQSGKGQQTAKLGIWNRDGSNRWVYTFASGTRNPVIRATATAIFCAWIQSEPDAHEAVFAAWWDKDGHQTTTPVRLGAASKTTWNLNASLDERGKAWVVFDAEVTTRSSEVYVATADTPGAIQLTKDDGAPSKYPDLSIGAGGRAALSWQDERDGNVEVYLLTSQVNELTGEIDGRSRRVTNTPGESIGAYLVWNGDRLGLAWSDKTSGQHEVHFTSFDGNGTMRDAPRQITDNSTWSIVPAIRPSGGGFALAWNEYVPASVEIHDGTSEVFFHSIP
jgi:hypothetical protein